jgi:hypothetical protein
MSSSIAVARIHGDETRNWPSKDIMLTPAQVDFKGDIVDAIRVKPAPTRKPPTTSTNGGDDDPPFDDNVDEV